MAARSQCHFIVGRFLTEKVADCLTLSKILKDNKYAYDCKHYDQGI